MKDGGVLGFRTLHLEKIELQSRDKSLVQEASELDFGIGSDSRVRQYGSVERIANVSLASDTG